MKDYLNVCLLNDSFPPNIDGVANTVVNYANIIQRKYGNAYVATPYYPDVKDNYLFEVMRYPSLDTSKFVGYRTGMPLDLTYLTKYYDLNIDLLHSHCPIASTFLARILRHQLKKPIILTYHTKFDIDIRNAINGKFVQDVAINALVENISTVDEVWVVSRGAGENLKSLGYKGDYIVMPNGVDFTKGKSSEETINAIREEYGLKKDVPTYLFVGRMMWYKGIKIILDALKILDDHGRDFKMMFVGANGEIEEIMQYARDLKIFDKCIFTGAVRDREKLKGIFSSCDLFLFPSTFDTNGIVVREAAASGLGSVLIKDSCAAEDVTDDRNAILINENADAMARVLLERGDQLDYLHDIGEHAMNELYSSWEESVDRAVARYREVVEGYEYKKPKFLDMDYDMLDSFFMFYADIATSIDNVKKANEELKFTRKRIEDQALNNLEDFLDRWL